MRQMISCAQCFQESGRPSNEFARVEFRDDGRYELVCPFGHTTTTLLQQQKFEVLFEIGAYAILDGYYREAVSSFSTSLERFYEFAVRVFLESASNSDVLFQNCWKKVSSQSERQLGAFIFLWGHHFNEVPKLLPDSLVSFRNDVVHKGKIPTREEAIKYGGAILTALIPKLLALKSRFQDEAMKVTFYHLRDNRSQSDEGRVVSTMCISTIVDRASADFTNQKIKTLNEYLVQLTQWKEITGG